MNNNIKQELVLHPIPELQHLLEMSKITVQRNINLATIPNNNQEAIEKEDKMASNVSPW